MKGVIFVELLSFIDDVLSPNVTEAILADCALASKGYYTSVGTYDDEELFALVSRLSVEMNTPASELCFLFGQRLLKRFSVLFSTFFEQANDAFEFLESVDNHIHVEVKKLYPDAKVPAVICERSSADRLNVTYRSHRQMADVAHGLILGALDHYNMPCELTFTTIQEGGGQCTLFSLTRQYKTKAA